MQPQRLSRPARNGLEASTRGYRVRLDETALACGRRVCPDSRESELSEVSEPSAEDGMTGSVPDVAYVALKVAMAPMAVRLVVQLSVVSKVPVAVTMRSAVECAD